MGSWPPEVDGSYELDMSCCVQNPLRPGHMSETTHRTGWASAALGFPCTMAPTVLRDACFAKTRLSPSKGYFAKCTMAWGSCFSLEAMGRCASFIAASRNILPPNHIQGQGSRVY